MFHGHSMTTGFGLLSLWQKRCSETSPQKTVTRISKTDVSGHMFKLRAGRSGVWIPVGKWVVSSSKRPNRLWGSLCLLFNWYQGYFLEVKWPGRKLNRSLPSSAKVKNKWSYTSNSFARLQLYLSLLTRSILRITCKRIPSSMYNVVGTLNKYENGALEELYWQRNIEVPDKKPTHCHFVHQKFHNEWVGIERGFRRWQADD